MGQTLAESSGRKITKGFVLGNLFELTEPQLPYWNNVDNYI